MANWTGTISTNSTMNDGDHITGNVTVNDGVTLTISAGATILVDGNYTLTNNGKATYVGTSTGIIIIKSSVAQPKTNSWGGLTFTNIDTASAVAYIKIHNALQGINLTGTTSSTQISFNNIYLENCYRAVVDATSNANAISNIRVYMCNGAFIISNNTKTLTITNGELVNCIWVFGDPDTAQSSPNATLALSAVRLKGMARSQGSQVKFDLDNCLFDDNNGHILGVINGLTTAGNTADNCLFTRTRTYINTPGDGTFTNCDFIANPAYYSYHFFGGGALNTFTGCYFAGGGNNQYAYDNSVPDTYTSGANSDLLLVYGILAMNSIRTTPNFSFAPASIVESGIDDNNATIAWSAGFKTKHRIKYGTVSGTYTMVAEPDYDWTNWDGLKTIMTTTPSITLANLKSGTKYFYVVESWDWALEKWVTSAEGDFTTTSTIPTISNITLSTTSMTTTQSVVITITASNSPTTVGVKINNKVFLATLSGSDYVATILGSDIGIGNNFTVTGYALNANGGVILNAGSTLTITQSSYTDYFNSVINDLKALISTEFTDSYVCKGDIETFPSLPAITIEPLDKNIDTDVSIGKKDFSFDLQLWIYTNFTDDEGSVIEITDRGEKMEQLLITNKKYPVANGSSWYNSNIIEINYGLKPKANGNKILRACLVKLNLKRREVR